jgi:hypothetical protein
MAVHAIMLKS